MIFKKLLHFFFQFIIFFFRSSFFLGKIKHNTYFIWQADTDISEKDYFLTCFTEALNLITGTKSTKYNSDILESLVNIHFALVTTLSFLLKSNHFFCSWRRWDRGSSEEGGEMLMRAKRRGSIQLLLLGVDFWRERALWRGLNESIGPVHVDVEPARSPRAISWCFTRD